MDWARAQIETMMATLTEVGANVAQDQGQLGSVESTLESTIRGLATRNATDGGPNVARAGQLYEFACGQIASMTEPLQTPITTVCAQAIQGFGELQIPEPADGQPRA
jgi:hypothetical protein